MQVGVGISQQVDTTQAIAEATQQALQQAQLQTAQWGMVFCTPHHARHISQIQQGFLEHSGCQEMAGCSAPEIMNQDHELRNGPGMAVLLAQSDSTQVTSFVLDQLRQHTTSVPQQLRDVIDHSQHPEPLVLLFPDANQQHAANLTNALNYSPVSPQAAGIGVMGTYEWPHVAVFGKDKLASGGVSGLLMDSQQTHVVGIAQSCKPIGLPMFITAGEGNNIETLDDYPALDVFATLAQEFGIDDSETAARHLLLGFPIDSETPQLTEGECLLRQVSGIDVQKRGLVVPHIVEPGKTVSFFYRSTAAAEEQLYQTLENLKSQLTQPAKAIISLRCDTKGSLFYQNKDVEASAIQDVFGSIPVIGVSGAFEMATTQTGTHLYSYVGILIALC